MATMWYALAFGESLKLKKNRTFKRKNIKNREKFELSTNHLRSSSSSTYKKYLYSFRLAILSVCGVCVFFFLNIWFFFLIHAFIYVIHIDQVDWSDVVLSPLNTITSPNTWLSFVYHSTWELGRFVAFRFLVLSVDTTP